MGRKLGNALIVYGVVNFIACWFLPGIIFPIGGGVWLVILVLLGRWQRNKGTKKPSIAEEINRVLDERENRTKREG